LEDLRTPPFGMWARLVGGNAFILSLIYLGVGLGAELLRHAYPTRGVSHVLAVLEQTPGRALEALGLMDLLREAYRGGNLSSFGVRWAYGFTMMVIILSTAAAMALIMAGAHWLWTRTRKPSARG
jgi:hypothetical protein